MPYSREFNQEIIDSLHEHIVVLRKHLVTETIKVEKAIKEDLWRIELYEQEQANAKLKDN